MPLLKKIIFLIKYPDLEISEFLNLGVFLLFMIYSQLVMAIDVSIRIEFTLSIFPIAL